MGSLSTRAGRFKATKASELIPFLATFAALTSMLVGLWPGDARSAVHSARNEPSLCRLGEVVIASCPIGQKLVSVCGRSSRAIYRFGRADRIELSASVMHHAQQTFSGGGESQIVVTRGAYQYVLYDRTIRTGFGREGRNDPAFSSGLMVLRNGRHLANMLCAPRNEVMIDANSAPNFMPAGAYIGVK